MYPISTNQNWLELEDFQPIQIVARTHQSRRSGNHTSMPQMRKLTITRTAAMDLPDV